MWATWVSASPLFTLCAGFASFASFASITCFWNLICHFYWLARYCKHFWDFVCVASCCCVFGLCCELCRMLSNLSTSADNDIHEVLTPSGLVIGFIFSPPLFGSFHASLVPRPSSSCCRLQRRKAGGAEYLISSCAHDIKVERIVERI